jgi:hypothetical protein
MEPSLSSIVENEKFIQFHMQELQSLRSEIDWRAKMAYSGSVIFISVFSFGIAQVFSAENRFIETVRTDADLQSIVLKTLMIVISVWAGVMNANHIIITRLEFYYLKMCRIIGDQCGTYFSSWFVFGYGSKFFHSTVKEGIARFLMGAIGILYFFPNLIILYIWYYIIQAALVPPVDLLFIVATFFMMISIGGSVFLLVYKVKVTQESKNLYPRTFGSEPSRQRVDARVYQ